MTPQEVLQRMKRGRFPELCYVGDGVTAADAIKALEELLAPLEFAERIQKFVDSQVEMEPEFKKALYENLGDLYD